MSEFYHLAKWYNRADMLNIPIPTLISRILTLVIAFSVHEFAHAWTANQLGDDTPRRFGRLTLNPLAHLDVLGSIMLVVSGFGWAKPVPVNPYELRRRSPAGMMLVAAAGPLSNLILALIAAIPFQAGIVSPFSISGSFLPTISSFLTDFILINLVLLFFNLIPLSPLDGEKVVTYFLPPSGQDAFDQLRPYGPMILLALLFLLPMIGVDVFRYVVGWPATQVFSMLVL
jgi:Zn-dependent protease